MENNELLSKKLELIEKVENWNTRGEEGEAMQSLIIKLLKGTDCTDPDFKEALEDGTAEAIISLDLDCYNLADFVKWLARNDFDLFINYRYADKAFLVDVIKEAEETGEAPDCCYNFDIDDFKELKTKEEKGEYIKDHFDGLLYSDEVLVISW